MPDQSSNAAALAAAEWWARAVCNPSYNNGDGMTAALATLAFGNVAAGQDSAARFAVALARRVKAQLDDFAPNDWSVTLDVDYGPDRMLAEAARESGIGNRAFPWKTMMHVRPEYVTVSAGYGAATRLVWASDAWLATRPVCDSQQYDDEKYRTVKGYHGEPWNCSLPRYHDGDHQYDRPLALCGRCGAPEEYWHSDERRHDPDRHEFVLSAEVTR